MARLRYMVVIERGDTSWGAHVPDLPGCVAIGETREEVRRLIREAIEFHIDGLREDGLPVPAPTRSPVPARIRQLPTGRLWHHPVPDKVWAVWFASPE